MRARARSMRYFPPSASRSPAMFALEPFERPLLPRRGRYVVLYCDERGHLIGTPRFTIGVNQRERYLRFTDGDRSKAASRASAARRMTQLVGLSSPSLVRRNSSNIFDGCAWLGP